MKRTTFIVVLLTLSLTGCGSSSNTAEVALEKANKAVQRVDELEAELDELSSYIVSTDVATPGPEDVSSEEVPSESSSEDVVEQKTIINVSAVDLTIPQIPLESENIKATILFCGTTIELSASSEEKREHLDVTTLPYYGGDVVRTCDFTTSGVTVNAIYRMDSGNWTPIEGLQFDPVDNTYLASLYIEGTDTNVFMVQTVNGSHYYFGIRSKY